MNFVRKVAAWIPGFRQRSSQSMVIAGTYYGVSLLVLTRYWHWGLALLAFPFFLFFLLDTNSGKRRRRSLAVAAAAGVCVLVGVAAGLAGGSLLEPAETHAAAARTEQVSAAALSTASARSSGVHTADTGAATQSSALRSPTPGKAAETRAADTLAPAASSVAPQPTVPAVSPAPAEQGEYAYVASKNGKVFHLPGCSSAKQIKPENRIGFHTREEAATAGLAPCKRCKP